MCVCIGRGGEGRGKEGRVVLKEDGEYRVIIGWLASIIGVRGGGGDGGGMGERHWDMHPHPKKASTHTQTSWS